MRALLLPLLLLSACAYDVEAWWTDLAQAHCDCQYPDLVRRDCVAEVMADYQGAPEWESCRDDPAPVARQDVNEWIGDYTESCRLPAAPAPAPEDPNWAQSCD